MRICNVCTQLKPYSEFHKKASGKDGYRNQCKSCRKIKANLNKEAKIEYDKKRYLDNKEAFIDRASEWKKTEKGRACVRRVVKRYRQKYPEKTLARNYVSQAKRRGIIPPIEEMVCYVCNNQAKHYHHYNGYKHRLDIIPLCIKCHNDIHNNIIPEPI